MPFPINRELPGAGFDRYAPLRAALRPPEGRFDAQLRETQATLQRLQPQTLPDSLLDQSSLALVGDARALDADHTIPRELRGVLTNEMTQLGRVQAAGGAALPTAEQIARTLNQFQSTVPFNTPSTNATLKQAQSDVGYLLGAASAAAFGPPGDRSGNARFATPLGGNTITPQVEQLIEQTGQPRGEVGTALRKLEGNLLSLAANTGNTDTPPPVHRDLQEVVNSVRDVIEGATPLPEAPGEIGESLSRFVATLKANLGGSAYGARESLKALAGNLRELSYSQQDQAAQDRSAQGQAAQEEGLPRRRFLLAL